MMKRLKVRRNYPLIFAGSWTRFYLWSKGRLVFPDLQPSANNPAPTQFAIDEFAKVREKLWEQRTSSIDKIDNLILTFSSAFLGLSITFLKDVVAPRSPSHSEILWNSWGLFITSIVCVFASHYCSFQACGYELKRNEYYFVKRIDNALFQKNGWLSLTRLLNSFAAAFFIGGILLSALFVQRNTASTLKPPPQKEQVTHVKRSPARKLQPLGLSKSTGRHLRR